MFLADTYKSQNKWILNFPSEENLTEKRKECKCKKKISQQKSFKKNANDAAEAIIQVMMLCGIPEYKARRAFEILVKSLTFFDEIVYRVDRVPKKRFCREDLIYRLSCCCHFSRKETQLTFAIARRVFRALYFNTRQCGERIDPNIQTRHSQECAFVHAAKKISQIFTMIEGMFYKNQIMFEKRIMCVFKGLHDILQQRATGYELLKCKCSKCAEEKKLQAQKCAKAKDEQVTKSSSSSEKVTDPNVKFCQKVCDDRLEEWIRQNGNIDEELTAEVERQEKMDIKCKCPKLICEPSYIADFHVPSLESSQGPFIVKWLPMADDEDICDDICSEPVQQDPCVESVSEVEYICDLDHICESEGEKEQFFDDFNEGTISLVTSQQSCQPFRCPSDTMSLKVPRPCCRPCPCPSISEPFESTTDERFFDSLEEEADEEDRKHKRVKQRKKGRKSMEGSSDSARIEKGKASTENQDRDKINKHTYDKERSDKTKRDNDLSERDKRNKDRREKNQNTKNKRDQDMSNEDTIDADDDGKEKPKKGKRNNDSKGKDQEYDDLSHLSNERRKSDQKHRGTLEDITGLENIGDPKSKTDGSTGTKKIGDSTSKKDPLGSEKADDPKSRQVNQTVLEMTEGPIESEKTGNPTSKKGSPGSELPGDSKSKTGGPSETDKTGDPMIKNGPLETENTGETTSKKGKSGTEKTGDPKSGTGGPTESDKNGDTTNRKDPSGSEKTIDSKTKTGGPNGSEKTGDPRSRKSQFESERRASKSRTRDHIGAEKTVDPSNRKGGPAGSDRAGEPTVRKGGPAGSEKSGMPTSRKGGSADLKKTGNLTSRKGGTAGSETTGDSNSRKVDKDGKPVDISKKGKFDKDLMPRVDAPKIKKPSAAGTTDASKTPRKRGDELIDTGKVHGRKQPKRDEQAKKHWPKKLPGKIKDDEGQRQKRTERTPSRGRLPGKRRGRSPCKSFLPGKHKSPCRGKAKLPGSIRSPSGSRGRTGTKLARIGDRRIPCCICAKKKPKTLQPEQYIPFISSDEWDLT